MLSSLFVFSVALMQSSSGLVQGEVFEGDSRLEKVISVRVDAEPIKQLLAKVSEQTGVVLDSTDYVGKQNVVLFMKEKKASHVLKTLAKHFDFSWEKTSSGYKLIQTEKQKQTEKREYEKDIIDKYQTIREDAKKGLEKLQGVSFSETQKRMDALHEQIKKLSDEFYGKYDNYDAITEKEEKEYGEKVKPLYAELRKLQQDSDPFAKLACRVILDLSDSRILELDSRYRLVFSTHPTQNQLRLSSSAYQYALQGVNDYVLRLQLAQHKMEKEMKEMEGKRGREDIEQIDVSDYDIYRFGQGLHAKRIFTFDEVGAVRVTLTAIATSGAFPSRWNRPNLEIAIIGKDGNVLAENYNALRFQSEYEYEYYEDEEMNPAQLPKEEVRTDKAAILDDLIPETEELIDFYRSIFSGSEFGGGFSVILEVMKPGNRYEPLNVFGKLLNEVASATKQDLISDCHDAYLASLFSIGRLSPTITLRRFLDSISNNLSMDWKLEDGLLSLRSQEWALNRAINIDRDIAYTIRDIVANNAGMGLEDMGRISQMLTDKQSESAILLLVFGPINESIADESKANLYFHRFWHVLDSGSKRALMDGRSISYSVLNSDAKRFLGEYLYRNGEVLAGGEDFGDYMRFESYFDDTEAESFLKEVTDLLNAEGVNEGSNDSEITQRLPFGIPPDTMIKLFYKKDDALTVKLKYSSNEFQWTVSIFEYVALKGQKIPDEIDVSFSKDVKPATIDRYNFVFFFTPRDATLRSARYRFSSPNVQFVPPQSLPPHIIQKIEKEEKNWIERRKQWQDDGDGGN